MQNSGVHFEIKGMFKKRVSGLCGVLSYDPPSPGTLVIFLLSKGTRESENVSLVCRTKGDLTIQG